MNPFFEMVKENLPKIVPSSDSSVASLISDELEEVVDTTNNEDISFKNRISDDIDLIMSKLDTTNLNDIQKRTLRKKIVQCVQIINGMSPVDSIIDIDDEIIELLNTTGLTIDDKQMIRDVIYSENNASTISESDSNSIIDEFSNDMRESEIKEIINKMDQNRESLLKYIKKNKSLIEKFADENREILIKYIEKNKTLIEKFADHVKSNDEQFNTIGEYLKMNTDNMIKFADFMKQADMTFDTVGEYINLNNGYIDFFMKNKSKINKLLLILGISTGVNSVSIFLIFILLIIIYKKIYKKK